MSQISFADAEFSGNRKKARWEVEKDATISQTVS